MMILDTNIISEMMKANPAINLIKWLDEQEVMQLFITTITIAEITYGLHVLPKGNRRSILENAFNNAVMEAFKHRILSFDVHAAYHYGKLMSQRKTLGRPLSLPDGQIASIAGVHDAVIVTRNTRDFINCELELINPFELD